MNELERRAIDLMLDPVRYVYPVDRARIAVVLRGLPDDEQREYAREKIRAGMKETLAYRTRWQRDWQTNVSRRPQRGRHHDSWEIREKYVRAT